MIEEFVKLAVLFAQLSAIFTIGAIIADYIVDPILRKK